MAMNNKKQKVGRTKNLIINFLIYLVLIPMINSNVEKEGVA